MDTYEKLAFGVVYSLLFLMVTLILATPFAVHYDNLEAARKAELITELAKEKQCDGNQ